MSKSVVVIGAGAAGLMSAITIALNGGNVVLLEKTKRAGQKLLITGKGRCNITNLSSLDNFYKNIHPKPKFLRSCFNTYFNKDLIDFFADNGLKVKEERGKRVFPTSDKSIDVVNVFMRLIKKLNIEIKYESKLTKINLKDKRINAIEFISPKGKETISTDKLIIACGGKSYPATGSDGNCYGIIKGLGHTITDTFPSLVPLLVKEESVSLLQGLSLKNAKAHLIVDNKNHQSEFGELLFTHYGLSGPIILTLSRNAVKSIMAKQKIFISIDLKPALDEKKLDLRLQRDLNKYSKRTLENIFKLWLPQKMISFFIKELELDSKKQGHQINSRERKSILKLMKNLRFTIIGHRGFKEAIVTAGGVNTNEINSKTMESKLINGLFFAGEVIDLDANTGGYNLQIAFSTGYLAGKNII